MFPYRIVTEWSAADEAYVSRVPALNAAAHGATAAEAATEAQQAAELMLDVLGESAPASDAGGDYSGNIRLRLPRSLHASLSRLATTEGVSLNQLMVTLLSRAEALSASAEGEARGLARAEEKRAEERAALKNAMARARASAAVEDAERILVEGTKAPARPEIKTVLDRLYVNSPDEVRDRRDPRDLLAFVKDRGRGKLEKRPAGKASKKETA